MHCIINGKHHSCLFNGSWSDNLYVCMFVIVHEYLQSSKWPSIAQARSNMSLALLMWRSLDKQDKEYSSGAQDKTSVSDQSFTPMMASFTLLTWDWGEGGSAPLANRLGVIALCAPPSPPSSHFLRLWPELHTFGSLCWPCKTKWLLDSSRQMEYHNIFDYCKPTCTCMDISATFRPEWLAVCSSILPSMNLQNRIPPLVNNPFMIIVRLGVQKVRVYNSLRMDIRGEYATYTKFYNYVVHELCLKRCVVCWVMIFQYPATSI